jgi:transcriptional accessory protein Tex/SPT6
VHISELSDTHVEDPSTLVKLGETKKFRIIAIDPEAHKLSLSLKSRRRLRLATSNAAHILRATAALPGLPHATPKAELRAGPSRVGCSWKTHPDGSRPGILQLQRA